MLAFSAPKRWAWPVHVVLNHRRAWRQHFAEEPKKSVGSTFTGQLPAYTKKGIDLGRWRLKQSALWGWVTPELAEVIEAQAQGLVHHIISKPWRLAELVSIVERAISMRDFSTAVSRHKDRQKK